MKLKAFAKDIRREFSKTFSRFLSITLIVCLGVGFFAGMKATAPSMIATAQDYFNQYNIMDYKLLSLTGFSQDDLDAVMEVDEIKDAVLGFSVDALMTHSSVDGASAYKIYSLPEEDRINQLELIEGRLPEKDGECVVCDVDFAENSFKLGDTLTLCEKTGDTQMDTVLKDSKYTVVGIISTPMYFSYSYGSTSIGDGSINAYMYVMPDEFLYEKYTEIYATLDIDYDEITLFDEEYNRLLEETSQKLEEVGKARQKITLAQLSKEMDEQYSQAQEDAQGQLDDAQQQLDDAKNQLDDAKNQLDDAREQIEDGQQELDEGWAEYNQQRGSYEAQIAAAQQQINDGEAQLAAGKSQLEAAKAELSSSQQQLQEGQQLLTGMQNLYSQASEIINSSTMTTDEKVSAVSTAISLARTAISNLRASGNVSTDVEGLITQAESMMSSFESGIDSAEDKEAYLQSQLASIGTTISDFSAQLDAYQAEANAAQAQIDDAQNQINAGEAQLAAAKAEYAATVQASEQQFADARNQLTSAGEELADAKEEYDSGVAEYEDGLQQYTEGLDEFRKSETDAKDELGKAAAQIQNAKDSFVELSYDRWYVFTRDDAVPSYSGLSADAQRIDALSILFPIFFLVVAALVCVTTMTRMVDEQRGQMGTYKALGYSKKQIMRKYLVYSLVASIAGGLIGEAACVAVFPKVIIGAYGILYTFPRIIVKFPVLMGGIALAVGIACTALVTFICCRKEIGSVTAALMRPRAPKAGRQILLERTALWQKLGFSTKITIRNLFRYKIRVLMTVLGISGCTALILAGFGLKNALDPIVSVQYHTLSHFDFSVAAFDSYDNKTAQKSKENLLAHEELKIEDLNYMLNIEIKVKDMSGEKEVNNYCYLAMPQDMDSFLNQWNLRQSDGTPVELTGDGVVLTDKLAKLLGVSAGDQVQLIVDETIYPVSVTGVIENYVQHYVYMLPETYSRLFKKAPSYNCIFGTMLPGNKLDTQQLLATDSNLLTVQVLDDIEGYMNDTFDSMNMVILVLILSASALAVVVLYNLTNINISERIREIATTKVLGFTQKESNMYIFRENIIMTVISLILGCLCGSMLSNFIVGMVETDMVAFARNIYPISYVYAVGITVVVTLGVMVLMHFKIKKIDMVEALKSIE